MYLRKIFENVEPRKVFLVDGIGAVISAFLHGYVLIRLEKLIGMPVLTLQYLAIAATCFGLYSFSCYFFESKKWRTLLKIIAAVNLIYCGVTLGLIFYFSQSITVLGIIFFGVEIAIVSMLAYAEWSKAGQAL